MHNSFDEESISNPERTVTIQSGGEATLLLGVHVQIFTIFASPWLNLMHPRVRRTPPTYSSFATGYNDTRHKAWHMNLQQTEPEALITKVVQYKDNVSLYIAG